MFNLTQNCVIFILTQLCVIIKLTQFCVMYYFLSIKRQNVRLRLIMRRGEELI